MGIRHEMTDGSPGKRQETRKEGCWSNRKHRQMFLIDAGCVTLRSMLDRQATLRERGEGRQLEPTLRTCLLTPISEQNCSTSASSCL
ncbi:hypothetical protein MUK42_25930 [Musa troglodytarum]|uniref:Uncharacterized protein n=1 Tax=Musa troglodytarum TaxID=320322 RepID=A0A9E7E883_9LILI|nr:hypothetical protein MUK42_25930 [Musa troglodytarum]